MINFKFLFLFFILSFHLNSQTLSLNESFITDHIRTSQLLGEFDNNISLSILPLEIGEKGVSFSKNVLNTKEYSPTLLKFFKNNGEIKLLPIDYNIEFNSHHPYNRNNGSMIPNRGYQHIISAGIYARLGPLSIQFKPEHLYAQNQNYQGFYDDHKDKIWANRYNLWNRIDIPEKFGEKEHNKTLLGQSNIRLNFKGISLGVSNENIWWGPSIRNSIMMSNHASGFKHVTFNTIKPLKTFIGNFEWQLVSGRLDPSGFTPPNTDRTYQGDKLYVPQGNQTGNFVDWRYFQGLVITYNPKWIPNLHLGYIRWSQYYRALLDGEYTWMLGNPGYFPVFSNLFRKNDKLSDIEDQMDHAAGLFFRWVWKDSNAELYGEFHYNDAKLNIRDLLLDSDHARGATIGLQKVFCSKNKKNNFLFSWEWTQLEQTGGRLLRNAGSWYIHSSVTAGYTNKGEVMGAGIGPGSNSHFFSISKINKKNKISLFFEIIDQDNDFYYFAFEDTKDYRRYWKDYNINLNYTKKLNKIWFSSNILYSRNLNYQWKINESGPEYYPAENHDTNNFHANLKLTYFIPF